MPKRSADFPDDDKAPAPMQRAGVFRNPEAPNPYKLPDVDNSYPRSAPSTVDLQGELTAMIPNCIEWGWPPRLRGQLDAYFFDSGHSRGSGRARVEDVVALLDNHELKQLVKSVREFLKNGGQLHRTGQVLCEAMENEARARAGLPPATGSALPAKRVDVINVREVKEERAPILLPPSALPAKGSTRSS